MSAPILDKLNTLLADYHITYMNTRGYHWNVQGKGFFTYHVRLEEIYTILADTIDSLAEHILMLGGHPDHAYSIYLSKSHLKERIGLSDAMTIFSALIDDFSHLCAEERGVIALCDPHGQVTTIDLLTKFLAYKEKLLWMMRSVEA